MSAYFPLFLNMEGRKIRVFGGGKIAARRVKILLEFGANVYVTAPEMEEELELLAKCRKGLTLDYNRYCAGELAEEEMVFAATDDADVNDAIYEECREKGIPVNVASDKEKCDFYFPAVIRTGNLTVGLTSGGEDHRKAAEAAERIRKILS